MRKISLAESCGCRASRDKLDEGSVVSPAGFEPATL